MEQQNILLIGGLTAAIFVTIYLVWGPTPGKRKKKGGVVGLVNLGSTCFLNTLLQGLASCALFVEWLDQQTGEEKLLTSALQSVLWILNGDSEFETHSPDVVLTVLRKHGWNVLPGEQDAHELFHCIVSTLQEENAKPPKAGSLSDALPPSDTLSQTSDILEDPFESLEPEPPVSELPIEMAIGDTGSDASGGLSVYEDVSSRGDTSQFYSVDSGGDSSRTLKMTSPKKPPDADSLRRGVVSRSGTSPPCTGVEPPPFTGLLASSLTCCVCNHASSVRTDTFDSVSLTLGESFSLAPRHTLSDLVRQFVRTEIVPDVFCEKCAINTSAVKTYNFGKLPPCLCFHIVRTTWLSSSHTSSKRDDHVDFPEYLVMDPFTWRPGASPPPVPSTTTAKHLYRLKSVVVHVGSANSGHFLTYRRGPLASNRRHGVDGKGRTYADSLRWYVASDELVELSSMKKAMDSLAYMLFYEKCSSDILSSLLGEPSVF